MRRWWMVAVSLPLAALALLPAPFQRYLDTLMPLYAMAIDWYAPEFDVTGVASVDGGRSKLVRAELSIAAPVYRAHGVVPAGVTLTASTLAGHTRQHLLLAALVLVAGSVLRAANWRLLLAVALALVCVEWLDTPLVIAGAGLDLLYAGPQATTYISDPRILGMHVMNGGGRLALPLVLPVLFYGALGIPFSARRASEK